MNNLEEEYKKTYDKLVICQKALIKVLRENSNYYGEIVGVSGGTALEALEQTGVRIDEYGFIEPRYLS